MIQRGHAPPGCLWRVKGHPLSAQGTLPSCPMVPPCPKGLESAAFLEALQLGSHPPGALMHGDLSYFCHFPSL